MDTRRLGLRDALVPLRGVSYRGAVLTPAGDTGPGNEALSRWSTLAVDYSALIGARVGLYASAVATDQVVFEGTYGGRELTVTITGVQTKHVVGSTFTSSPPLNRAIPTGPSTP